jgi:membrane protease YdiL (CAAX protease family)
VNVRPGWIVVAFVAVALAAEGMLVGLASLLQLLPTLPMTLETPRVATTSFIHLFAAIAASAVAWVMGEKPGLHNPRGALPGVALGGLLLTLTVVIGGLFSGSVGVSPCSSRLESALKQLAFIGPTSFAEELLMRGAAFRALARAVTPQVAIIGAGLIFGVLHLSNPNASIVAAANVALVGIWFGTLAWRAQSIWPAVGAHFAWNFFEGWVWGQNVSGIRAACSLFTATSRPPFFGGGSFGPEASGLTCLILALACAATAFWPSRAHGPQTP